MTHAHCDFQQIIGYMNPIFAVAYPDGFSKTIKTRLSNSYLIGEIFGMLFFGFLIDKLGTCGKEQADTNVDL